MAAKKAAEQAEAPVVIEQGKAMDEMVTVRIPKSAGDDPTVFVGLNGQAWLIPRGKAVQVPRPVAQVLWRSDEFAEAAEAFEAKEAAKMNVVQGV